MLLHYVVLAFRIMTRNYVQTTLIVAGLSVGFACFFVLWAYSNEGLQADRFIAGADRIWRVGSYWRWEEQTNNGQMTCGTIPVDQARLILEDYPGQIVATRFLQQTEFDGKTTLLPADVMVKIKTDSGIAVFDEANAIEADQNLFDFFSLPLRYGDKITVLQKTNAVAISARTSIKYFGKEMPIGKFITVNDSITLEVTAVFEDIPVTSHLDFDLVVSNSGHLSEWEVTRGSWGRFYVRFSQASQYAEFIEMLHQNEKRYWQRELLRWPQRCSGEHFLQPLTEITYSNYFYGDHFKHRSYLLLLTLRGLALVIILIAGANYLSLTISAVNRRLKEVSTRKTSGAGVKDVMVQFATESLLIHTLAIGVSITVLQIAQTPVAEILELPGMPFYTRESLGIVAGYVTIISLVISIYPAYLTLRNSVPSLYARARGFGMVRHIISTLSVLQFSLAVGLMVGAIVVASQLWHIHEYNLGINRDNVLIVDLPLQTSQSDEERTHRLISELRSKYSVTYCYSIAGDAAQYRFSFLHPTLNYKVQTNLCGGVDNTFIPVMGMKLVAGRNFVLNDRADVIIISQFVAERLGFEYPEQAIGTRIAVDVGENEVRKVEVIGVVEDYMVEPMVNYGEARNIARTGNGDGMCLTYGRGLVRDVFPRKLLVLTDPEEGNTIYHIEEQVRKAYPEFMVRAKYLDEYVNTPYAGERHFAVQAVILMLCIIVISSLGFFGNIVNKISQKTKEIGIRKALGAGSFQLGMWLLGSTIPQVGMAICIALPAAFFFCQAYLQRYTVVFPIQWWHLAFPPLAFLTILLISVSGVIWKATRTNPVEALRYE